VTSSPDPRAHIRRLAADDPTGWYEPLYASGAPIPWDRSEPSALLVDWASGRDGTGRTAVVVGCGFGRDAEFLAQLGYSTTAFDISPTAVREARSRHPSSTVDYVTADLLSPPEHWIGGYDLVVESNTVQAMPDPPRAAAIASVGRLVARGGTLVVQAFAGPEADEGPPWPLSRAEIDAFAVGDLRAVRIERIPDATDPTTSRWRAEFHRPA
jgi:SAM-dependent methyltransferase